MQGETLLVCRKFRVERAWRQRADGGLEQREVVRHPGAVGIVPLLAGGRVCLVRNDRLAVGRVMIEIPAGTLEPGEPPEQTARRELAEETGYRAGRLEWLATLWMSPGILEERMDLYLAGDLAAGPRDLQPDESLENQVLPWSEALALVDRGEIQDAKTVAALLLVERRGGTRAAGGRAS